MKRLVLLALPLLLAGSAAQAKSHHSAALKWMDGPPGLPSGAKFAVVSGDPSKVGMFTIRARLPANYTVPPHHHPTDEKVSVKSGGPLAVGMGDKLDKSNAASVEKGYHVTLPANMNHWAASAEPSEIEISAMGPFAITYANPADDPRGAPAKQ
jgi:hypothetical protein